MSLPRDKCNVPMDAFARGKYELESLLAKVLLEEDAELEKAFVEFNTGSLEGIPKSLVKILTKGKDGDYIQLPFLKMVQLILIFYAKLDSPGRYI
ncbi:MAG UNVERIFIED_CONTAM: hypothetical protein LVQ98_04780 [Rickettsiaceae bacterium]|jgi:hypothetical protein